MSFREALAAVCARLKGLPGVVDAAPLADADRPRVLELESRYERQALIPLRNLGLREVLEREAVVVVLKDRHFREPLAPTLYLVEPAAGARREAPLLEAGGERFRVIGEERFPSSPPLRERTLSLSSTFVLFPERRSSAATPSFFLLPALPFPELEAAPGVRRVASISPSTAVDIFLRERCRLAPDDSLATLLVGFDPVHSASGGDP